MAERRQYRRRYRRRVNTDTDYKGSHPLLEQFDHNDESTWQLEHNVPLKNPSESKKLQFYKKANGFVSVSEAKIRTS